VLVVAHHDGWLEVFGDREHIDARIVMAPTLGGEPSTATQQRFEVLAEEYLELTIPRRYRDIYVPINRRAADKLRLVTPESIACRQTDIELLRAIERMGAELRGEVRAWML